MECYSLLVLKQSPLSHSQCRPFLTNLRLSWCSPISFGLLIPQEFFSHLSSCCKPHNSEIPNLFLGSQFSLPFVCSDLTDNSMNLIFCNKQKPSKYFATEFNLLPLGAEDIVVSCRLKWFFYIIYILKYSERRKLKKSPARSYRLGTS